VLDVDFALLRHQRFAACRAPAVARKAAFDLTDLYESTVGALTEGDVGNGSHAELPPTV
jgi:hypothetical protein